MKQHAPLLRTIKIFSLCMILITLVCISTFAQEKIKLKPTVYNSYIKSGATVKVQTVEDQKIQDTMSSTVANAQLDVTKKNVLRYPGKIAVLDETTLQRFREEAKTETPNEEIKVLPEIHVEPVNENTGGEPTTYRIVFTSQQPLRFNHSQNKFTGKLAFLLVNQSGPNVAPAEPVKIEINSDEISSISPGSFEITHLSIPSTNVELTAEHVTDSAKVKVITVSNPEGYTTYLKVSPLLDISSNRTKIQGWGIQEVPITVRFVGSNSTDSVKVTFTIEKGTVTPNPLMMRYNESATVHVRSEGMSKSRLTATANSIRSNDLTLNFTFPLYFLLATIAGGVAGSFIKYHSKANRKKLTTKIISIGIVTGLIGAAAYYVLGVNLLGLSFSVGLNEMAVFVISALFAYFGITLLKTGGE